MIHTENKYILNLKSRKGVAQKQREGSFTCMCKWTNDEGSYCKRTSVWNASRTHSTIILLARVKASFKKSCVKVPLSRMGEQTSKIGKRRTSRYSTVMDSSDKQRKAWTVGETGNGKNDICNVISTTPIFCSGPVYGGKKQDTLCKASVARRRP